MIKETKYVVSPSGAINDLNVFEDWQKDLHERMNIALSTKDNEEDQN